MTKFEGIYPPLAAALEKRGYETLTPVQQAVLAPEMADADALVSAQTGSGKTVAFGLTLAPTLLGGEHYFPRAERPLALAIAPTRELALQVKRELDWLYEPTGAAIASCVGGMDMRTERRALERGAHIVVGTPGRLRDHIERHSLDMSSLRAVVLDEADEMLDLGFREDLEFILGSAPETRRTLMFSATVPRAIATLAKNYQRDAVRITTTAEREQHADIDYQAMVVAPHDREHAIINVLRFHEARNALVFCSTRAAVNHLTARLNNRGFSVVALSGELSQSERTHALQAMRDGRARVCVATDVAARGIDLPGLELVIHADLPTNPETLLHRSGRTGRAGRKGVSALIVPVNARKRADRLLRMAQIQADWTPPPTAQAVIERDNERLIAHPLLAEPVSEDERAMVEALLEKHGAEGLAAGFMRLAREGKSAPEDVQPVADRGERGERREPREKKERQPFGEAVWFRLSVGRKQNAEPRWLLPMICRAGELTKRDIGAIRIQADETHVEISTGAADAFLAGLGDNMTLEKTIRVSRLEDEAPMEAAVHEPPRNAPPPKKPKKKSTKKYAGKPEAEHRARPKPPRDAVAPKANPFAGYADETREDKPAGQPSKPKGKKPFNKKTGGFKGKTGGGPSKAAKAKFGKSNFSKAKSPGKAGAKGKPKGKPARKP